jgi:hypothetical protein
MISRLDYMERVMGRFERKLDLDLIERMAVGAITPWSKRVAKKKSKPPRAGSTYRAARRNALKRVRHG